MYSKQDANTKLVQVLFSVNIYYYIMLLCFAVPWCRLIDDVLEILDQSGVFGR